MSSKFLIMGDLDGRPEPPKGTPPEFMSVHEVTGPGGELSAGPHFVARFGGFTVWFSAERGMADDLKVTFEKIAALASELSRCMVPAAN